MVNCLLEPLECGRFRKVNPLVARGAHGELKTDCHGVGVWCCPKTRVLLVPSGLDATLQAVLMEDVLTPELNH